MIEIMDLSSVNKSQILQTIKKLIQNTSYFNKFTIVYKRQLINDEQNKQNKFIDKNKNQLNNKTFQTFQKCLNIKEINNNQSQEFSLLKCKNIQIGLKEGKQKYNKNQFNQGLEIFKILQINLDEQLKNGKYQLNENQQQYRRYYNDIHFYQANCYFRLKDYEKAIIHYNIQLQNNNQNSKRKGQCMNNLGSCYAITKQLQYSLIAYNDALKIYTLYPEINCYILLTNIGMIYMESSMYSTAEKYFQLSIQERKNKQINCYSTKFYQLYLKLGMAQKLQNKYTDAVNSLLIANNFADKGQTDILHILKELSEIYQLQQNYSLALSYYQKLSDYYQEKSLNQGYIYQKVAAIYFKLNNFQEQEKFIKIAISQYRKQNNQRKLSQMMNKLRSVK